MKSIRRAMMLRLSLTTCALVIAAGCALYLYVRSALIRHFDETLLAKALAVGTQVKREGDGLLEFEFSPDSMPEFQAVRRPEYFEIWVNGARFRRSASLRGGDLPMTPTADSRSTIWNLSLPDGRAGRAVRLNVLPPDEPLEGLEGKERPGLHVPPGTHVLVVLAASRVQLDQTLGVLLTSLLVAVGGVAIGTAVAIAWTIGWGLRPLGRLGEQASTIGASSLGDRFATTGLPHELRPICQRLNDLLSRLQAAFERERRFTADVAHELRTPIAELRTLAEVSARWSEDPSLMRERWEDALQIAQQMESTVQVLLALARCENGRQAVDRQAIDLRSCFEDAWRLPARRAAARGVRAESCDLGGVAVLTDAALFSSILANVLANAADYAATDGQIIVRVHREAGRVILVVGNTNSTLTLPDLPRLFEPFWRKDPARTGGVHSGLGLALVQAYADLLGIEVSASLPSAGWFELRLAIPDGGTIGETPSRPALLMRQ